MKALICIILTLASLLSCGKTLHAGRSQKFTSIKSAINAADKGDTVIVSAGLYREGNIVIDKPIYFLGRDLPVLDGELKHEIVSVRSNSVTIRGFRLIRSGHGTLSDPGAIKTYNCDRITIAENILEDNFFGIYIQFGKHCRIENNKVVAHGDTEQQIGNGIHCWKSDSLLISGNLVSGHRDGIYFEFVTHSLITKNRSTANVRYGLHFMFSNDDSYVGNIFKGNGAGVAVMFTKRVKMYNNIFEENWGDAAYGLMLKEISDSHIKGNRFLRNTSGIHMEGTSRIVVEQNVFESNGWGMKIQASCLDNEIRGNNFIGNTFDISTNGSLVLNTFNGNYWDKYEGYDLNKDKVGDVPYRPLSLFSVIVENNPPAMLLFRSFMVTMLDKSEKILPSLTPDNFIDNAPLMKRILQ